MKRSSAIDDPLTKKLEAAQAKMQADVARTRLTLRGIGDLPLDRETAVRELTEEQRALRDSRPTNRRWRALDKLDQNVDKMQQRQVEAGARVHEAEAVLARAPEDDASALADWLAPGERGERPAASLYERQRDRDAARLLVSAATVEVDRALERRLQHIRSNRQKMLEDARRDVAVRVSGLRRTRGRCLACGSSCSTAAKNLLWCAAYPERVEGFGYTPATALGLLAPVKRTLGTDARIDYAALLEALAEDARAIAEANQPNPEAAARTGRAAHAAEGGALGQRPRQRRLEEERARAGTTDRRVEH